MNIKRSIFTCNYFFEAYRYQFEEIYIHYGTENNQGSEHQIHGYAFPGEVSFAYYSYCSLQTCSHFSSPLKNVNNIAAYVSACQYCCFTLYDFLIKNSPQILPSFPLVNIRARRKICWDFKKNFDVLESMRRAKSAERLHLQEIPCSSNEIETWESALKIYI